MIKKTDRFLRIAGGSSLLFSSWDDKETVVHHCLSGDTHTLNAFASAIVGILEGGSVTHLQLPALLASKLNYFEDDEFTIYVEEVVNELCKTGLIEVVLR